MKRIIIILIVFLLCSSQVNAKKGDDKWAHLFMGAYIAEQGKDLHFGFVENVLLVVCIGIVKEHYDKDKTGYNNDDIAMNVVGVLFSYSMDLLPFMNDGDSKEEDEKKWEPQKQNSTLRWEGLSL